MEDLSIVPRHESTPKIWRIALKHWKTMLRNIFSCVFLVDSKQSWHLLCTQLFYLQFFVPMISLISRTFTRQSSITIFLIFWIRLIFLNHSRHGDLNWTFPMWFILDWCLSMFEFINPKVNGIQCWCRAPVKIGFELCSCPLFWIKMFDHCTEVFFLYFYENYWHAYFKRMPNIIETSVLTETWYRLV